MLNFIPIASGYTNAVAIASYQVLRHLSWQVETCLLFKDQTMMHIANTVICKVVSITLIKTNSYEEKC